MCPREVLIFRSRNLVSERSLIGGAKHGRYTRQFIHFPLTSSAHLIHSLSFPILQVFFIIRYLSTVYLSLFWFRSPVLAAESSREQRPSDFPFSPRFLTTPSKPLYAVDTALIYDRRSLPLDQSYLRTISILANRKGHKSQTSSPQTHLVQGTFDRFPSEPSLTSVSAPVTCVLFDTFSRVTVT